MMHYNEYVLFFVWNMGLETSACRNNTVRTVLRINVFKLTNVINWSAALTSSLTVQMISDGLNMYTLTHIPGRIDPPAFSSSGAVTEEISRCQCASSHAGQNHCRVTARHHTSERARHGYLVGFFSPVVKSEGKGDVQCVSVSQCDI